MMYNNNANMLWIGMVTAMMMTAVKANKYGQWWHYDGDDYDDDSDDNLSHVVDDGDNDYDDWNDGGNDLNGGDNALWWP